MVALARHLLSHDVILKTVKLVVVGVERSGEVQTAEEIVLNDCLDTCAEVLGDVHVCLVHNAVGGVLILHALDDIRRGTVVSRQRQGVLVPLLQVVKRERVGIGGGELGVSELYH